MLPKYVSTRIFLKFEPEAAEMKPYYCWRGLFFFVDTPSLTCYKITPYFNKIV